METGDEIWWPVFVNPHRRKASDGEHGFELVHARCAVMQPISNVPARMLRGLEEFREGSRLRCIASGVGREHFDEVFAGACAVNDSWAAGTKYHVLEAAVHIDVVADVGLGVEVIGGLPPRQRHLKVAKTVRPHGARHGRRCRVVGIGRWRGQRDGRAYRRWVAAEIDGANLDGVSSGRLEEAENS